MPLDVAAAPKTVISTLHYLKRGTEKPASYRIEPPPGVPRWNGIDDPHEVTIEDARGRSGIHARPQRLRPGKGADRGLRLLFARGHHARLLPGGRAPGARQTGGQPRLRLRPQRAQRHAG